MGTFNISAVFSSTRREVTDRMEYTEQVDCWKMIGDKTWEYEDHGARSLVKGKKTPNFVNRWCDIIICTVTTKKALKSETSLNLPKARLRSSLHTEGSFANDRLNRLNKAPLSKEVRDTPSKQPLLE